MEKDRENSIFEGGEEQQAKRAQHDPMPNRPSTISDSISSSEKEKHDDEESHSNLRGVERLLGREDSISREQPEIDRSNEDGQPEDRQVEGVSLHQSEAIRQYTPEIQLEEIAHRNPSQQPVQSYYEPQHTPGTQQPPIESNPLHQRSSSPQGQDDKNIEPPQQEIEFFFVSGPGYINALGARGWENGAGSRHGDGTGNVGGIRKDMYSAKASL
ncbi:hypothetical protein HYFRA_00011366 [Hymenoscyphus fraxineus]|uniref:Uncharacterized protein n=1 Tax=Hymenoscyphus fraxineus TaxID=746836 RepID=A0A9N9L0J2_9HELO|nr:hypothetical protein HYFRA_00011366 [Hymenoscyphus fraxineus]